MADSGYPKREPFFSHRFCRLLIKTCVAQEIGPTSTLLLMAVVQTEDASHYRRPVTFYNEQLSNVIGVVGRNAFALARQKAIDAGWLQYIPGHKSKAGKYWVTIPPHAQNLDDLPTDEGFDNGEDRKVIKISSEHIEYRKDTSNGIQTGLSDTSNGHEEDFKPAPFIPVPDPVPDPKETPLPLSGESIDWLKVESDFVDMWNSTPGVAKCSRGIPSNLTGDFREAYLLADWLSRVRDALAKFPLRNGVKMSLRNFLQPSTLDEILGGVHDFERTGDARRGAGAGQDAARVRSESGDSAIDRMR